MLCPAIQMRQSNGYAAPCLFQGPVKVSGKILPLFYSFKAKVTKQKNIILPLNYEDPPRLKGLAKPRKHQERHNRPMLLNRPTRIPKPIKANLGINNLAKIREFQPQNEISVRRLHMRRRRPKHV